MPVEASSSGCSRSWPPPRAADSIASRPPPPPAGSSSRTTGSTPTSCRSSISTRARFGDDVLTNLQAMADEDLTIRVWLWLALGLAEAGDEEGARSIERALLEEHGQVLGPWVRLTVGSNLIDTE